MYFHFCIWFEHTFQRCYESKPCRFGKCFNQSATSMNAIFLSTGFWIILDWEGTLPGVFKTIGDVGFLLEDKTCCLVPVLFCWWSQWGVVVHWTRMRNPSLGSAVWFRWEVSWLLDAVFWGVYVLGDHHPRRVQKGRKLTGSKRRWMGLRGWTVPPDVLFLRGSSNDQMWDLSLYAVRPECIISESIGTCSRPPEARFFVYSLCSASCNYLGSLIHYCLLLCSYSSKNLSFLYLMQWQLIMLK